MVNKPGHGLKLARRWDSLVTCETFCQPEIPLEQAVIQTELLEAQLSVSPEDVLNPNMAVAAASGFPLLLAQ